MCCCKNLYRLITFITILGLPVIAPLPAPAQQTTLPEQNFSSVEERRLHVRIIEEHDDIINEKKALLLKEKELESLRAEIDRKLEEIDLQLGEMEKQKQILDALQSQKSEEDQLRIKNLSKIYENMDPIKAAQALADLDFEVAADILSYMKARSAAKILNSLTRNQAAEISRLFLTAPAE